MAWASYEMAAEHAEHRARCVNKKKAELATEYRQRSCKLGHKEACKPPD